MQFDDHWKFLSDQPTAQKPQIAKTVAEICGGPCQEQKILWS